MITDIGEQDYPTAHMCGAGRTLPRPRWLLPQTSLPCTTYREGISSGRDARRGCISILTLRPRHQAQQENCKMKFTCIQEDLSRALSIVSRAVSSKAILPVTQNVLLCAEDSRLKVTGTDLNTTHNNLDRGAG